MNPDQLQIPLQTLSTGAKGLRAQLSLRATVPADSQGDVLDMRASDETIDRYGEVIRADGWQLDNYRKNPVIQNAHQYGDIIFTIGKALTTEIEDHALVQRWEFASDVNPLAKIASGLYRGGFLHTSSVGFIPREWTNGKRESEPTRIYTKQELLEVSAVGIPANPNALALGYKFGAFEKSDLRELSSILKHLCKDEAGPQPNARAPGLIANGAQLMQLLNQTKALLK